MDYIYDIVLNFHETYYDFYEWHPKDKIINIKRIPIYKVSNNDYINLRNNNTTIDKNTLPKQNKMFLVTSGIEVLGLLIDDNGKVLKKSSLLFDESDEILEDKDSIKLINLKYKINKKNNIIHQSRIIKEKIKYINNYLHNIDKLKDKYILKYLYYDLYNIEEDNIDKIYNDLLELSKDNINKIYDSIKKINLEPKK